MLGCGCLGFGPVVGSFVRFQRALVLLVWRFGLGFFWFCGGGLWCYMWVCLRVFVQVSSLICLI